MRMEFTQDRVFSFAGPNLCLLGNEKDFEKLAKAILDITNPGLHNSIDIGSLDFVITTKPSIKVVFKSNVGGDKFGNLVNNELLIFELDDRYWERIFKFFVLMSWNKATYYLNSFEDCLRDLPLDQGCHFICSSEF